MKAAFVVFFACLTASALATPVNDCKNGIQIPKEVKISGCAQQPCPLVKGGNVTLEVTFKAPQYLTAINTEVIARALGIDVEYPLPEPDACKGLVNTKCPVEEGEEVIYKLVMPVLKSYPNINLGLTFTLQNEKKKGISCFQVNCKVVSSRLILD